MPTRLPSRKLDARKMSTIIIVDDQPVNRSVYAKMASSIDGCERVETFGDARKALEWMSTTLPDLVITDYRMPGMNGATFIRLMRSKPSLSDIPVIVITVYDEMNYRFRALDAGATDFLLSPVDHREFVTRARNLLKLRTQQLLLADRAERLEQELEYSERSLEQLVRDSSERLAQVIDSVPALISATDPDGRILFANQSYSTLLGINPIEIVGKTAANFLNEENAARRKAFDQMLLQHGTPERSFEEEIVDQRTGQKRIFLTTKSPLRDSQSQLSGVVTSSIDITERKRAESHLQHLATHDSLTDMPNRNYLRDRITVEIARSRRGDRHFALHLIDIDGFKAINDARGHEIGDKFLVALAGRMRSLSDKNRFIARMGGDEFAVLQTGISSDDNAAELAENIRTLIREPILVDGEKSTLKASIGISIYPNNGQDINDVIRYADLAMYRAKSAGGDQYGFYAADMSVIASSTIALDEDLRRAIADGEFVLFYQPQYRVDDGQIVGAEALIRWKKSDGTLVLPGAFLPRAEQNGLILPINEWVLQAACDQVAAWRRQGLPKFRISVNCSPSQFHRKSLPLFVTQVLHRSGLDAKSLDLELTENILLQDVEHVAIQLRQLRELGVGISIDDFGTGFSSLSYVKRLPIDRLKIDQFFMRDVTSDPYDRAIVGAIITLAHSLELGVVAEGVETMEQLDFLRAAGCDEMQGFLYGRPMPAGDFAALVAPARQLAIGE
jgi:diguanylate cyclase (GGDEF)-like protein/PAS domain S-box-containing protein